MDVKLILLLLFFTFHVAKSQETDLWVNPTLVKSDPGAVCLTGKPASYYYIPGYGNGTYNWLVYLSGGGWCANFEDCKEYADSRNITKDPLPIQFEYILSNNKDMNADFYNWNKVVINYCDGGSFTGDTEKVSNGTKLYFRGGRIYNAVMQELLKNGMRKAENALLLGGSAGGLAATLHCDVFRDLLPYAIRVKCLSDAGYFFPWRRFEDEGDAFIPLFQGLITLHGSTNWLPTQCTKRMTPYLCLFPQNMHQDIKTPIFFLMSSFDVVQVQLTFQLNATIQGCLWKQNCTSDMVKMFQDLRLEFLDVLPKQSNTSTTGILITSQEAHEHVRSRSWYFDKVLDGSNNETISKLFADWYYDKKNVQIVDQYPCPYDCSKIN